MALETRIIKQPGPIDMDDSTLFHFCPSCGEESLEPNTHLMNVPTISAGAQMAVNGWECTACGRFFTGTHLGISWCNLADYPLASDK